MLGVLVITGEYSTGMIRATLHRRAEAPAGAVGEERPSSPPSTFVLMLPSVLIAFFASQAILSRHHILQISFSHPGVARAVIGGAVYLIAGRGVRARDRRDRPQHRGRDRRVRGDLLRHPAAHEHPADELEQRDHALSAERRRPLDLLAHARLAQPRPWPGFALFCGYTALALAIAAVLLVRRDT